MVEKPAINGNWNNQELDFRHQSDRSQENRVFLFGGRPDKIRPSNAKPPDRVWRGIAVHTAHIEVASPRTQRLAASCCTSCRNFTPRVPWDQTPDCRNVSNFSPQVLAPIENR